MTRFAFLLLILFLLPLPVHAATYLDSPCTNDAIFSNNVWDMIIYHDRLYVGCGDYTRSTGPINVWVYTDASGWVSEFTVDEEQIARFRILNDVLVIPGIDSREDWSYGNWYERSATGEWTKHRDIPDALHVWDIFDYGGLRFAAIGADRDNPAVAISTDDGATWTTQIVPIGTLTIDTCAESYLGRTHIVSTFFTIQGQLYADTMGYARIACTDGVPRTQTSYRIVHWDGSGFQPIFADFFPGLPPSICCMLGVPIEYGDSTFYVRQSGSLYAFFRIDSTLNARRINLNGCTRPQDIAVSANFMYVLCNESSGENWHVSINVTCDGEKWARVYDYDAPSFARSFAIAGDTVYFSLGSDLESASSMTATTGEVYRDQLESPSTCPAGD